MYSLLGALALGAIGVLVAWIVLAHSRNTKRAGLPPGSMGLPLVGETLEFLSSKPTFMSHPFIEKHSAKYGDLFKSHLFGQPFIISVNMEVNNYILQNEGKLFQSCQPINAYRDILGRQTIVEIHGELHRRLHAAAVKVLSLDETKEYLFNFIQTLMLKQLPTWQDQIVHVHHEATYMVRCLILRCLISQDPEGPVVQQLNKYCIDVKGMLAFPFNVPGSGFSKHMQGRNRLVKFLEEVIVKARDSGHSSSEDLLNVLLEEEGSGLFGAQSGVILDNIVGILFHGEETLGLAMTLVMKFLSESPKALAQLKEEQLGIRKGKGRVEQLNWTDYESMRFTRNVINESLRLSNVVPWVFRVATEDVEVKGFTIPKGWKILVYLMGRHLDSTVYTDSKTFDPWRWQDVKDTGSFTPFGAGPRFCPGVDLARATLAVFLHFLVTKYSWQIIEDDEIIRFPVLTLQEGLPIVVKNMNDEDECLILH